MLYWETIAFWHDHFHWGSYNVTSSCDTESCLFVAAMLFRNVHILYLKVKIQTPTELLKVNTTIVI